MNLIFVLFCILLITTAGFIFLKTFKLIDEVNDFEKIPFAFGLGAGFIAFQLYLYSRLGISWDNFTIIIPWVVLTFTSIYLRRLSFTFKFKKEKFSIFSKILIILIFALLFFTFIESILRPVPSWDGWSNWLFRSKIFFIEGSITPEFFKYVPTDYPEFVSLMSTFIYKILGLIDDRNVLLLYPIFYLMTACLLFFSIKRIQGTKIALFFTFLLISTQNIVRHSGRFEVGQADVILGFYILTSSLLLIKFLWSKKIEHFVLLQLFLTITVFIKNEGVPFVLIVQFILLIFVIKNKLYKILPVFLIWFLPFAEWQFFKQTMNLTKIPVYIQSQVHLERFPLILILSAKELLNFKNWNLLWITFITSLLIYIFYIKKNKTIFILFLILLFQIGTYMGIFIFTTFLDPKFHIPNVLNRALLHLAPCAVYAIALVFHELKLDKKLKI